VLAACILNKLRGRWLVVTVKAPGFGDDRKFILGDLSILTLTGGMVFTDELEIKLERATTNFPGSTGSITITKEDSIMLNGEGSKDSIQACCHQLSGIIADPTTSEFDKTKLQEWLAKLSRGIAIIKIGGSSEVEVEEKEDQHDDALNTTHAAVEEGILLGRRSHLIKSISSPAYQLPENGEPTHHHRHQNRPRSQL